ncbi:hypothetical protein IFM89_039801 [Coptis chinensis]|uniref:Protein FAR1-RELATED SEQUENCE n=1 Tax=Coptis chinensis TaxID=261450 RepID=A0A835LCP8_9MAGN|nr:hypothetical protein IFM89_039801 [Coptis chinensis]
MVDISNEEGDWATNMCNDACPYEESDSSDTEINVVEGSTNVSLEDENESDDHSVSEIEGFEEQSNEADARSEQTNENDFNLFSGKLGGEDLDENAIMFSMRFKTSNEAFEFYNEYAKVFGFSVRVVLLLRRILIKGKEDLESAGVEIAVKQGIRRLRACTWPKPQSQASSSKVPTAPPPSQGDQ